MSANGLDSASLDRWITGGYGEDQFADVIACPKCGDDVAVQDEDFACEACGHEFFVDEGPDPDDMRDAEMEMREREIAEAEDRYQDDFGW